MMRGVMASVARDRPYTLYSRMGSIANPLATITGVTGHAAFTLPGGNGDGVLIPAGTLANFGWCRVTGLLERTNDNTGTSLRVWLSNNSAGVSGVSQITGFSLGASTNRQYFLFTDFTLDASGVMTTKSWASPGSQQVAIAADISTGWANTTDTWVKFGVTAASTSDTFKLVQASVEVL